MDSTFIIWLSVATLMVALISIRIIRAALRRHSSANNKRKPLFSIGTESEEFWVPGDSWIFYTRKADDRYDDYIF